MIENVLNAIEGKSYKEGAFIMYHFLNGMLVGGNIDLDKGIKRVQPFLLEESDLEESDLEKWFKQNSPTRSSPPQEGESTSKASCSPPNDA